jgi:hypothetical protein
MMIGSSFVPFADWALLHGAMLAPQGRSALYFEKVVVSTSSERTCMRFAGDVSRNQRFTNGHASGAEVAGEFGGAYIAITCVARGNQPALAVVMSVAPDFGVARQAGQQVAARLKGMKCFDQPC